MNTIVSDEALYAFIDGELGVAESETLIARMRDDKILAERVCALRSLQSMVRLAYVEPPVATGHPSLAAPHRRLIQHCALGSLILMLGLGGGWALRGWGVPAVSAQSAESGSGYQMVSLAHEADSSRVMLHLDSASPDKMLAVLDHAERLLDAAEQQGRVMQVDVIANSRGLDLLRAGHSPYAERMARMKQRHVNLNWVACAQSIARIRGEGENVTLLPATRVAPTAISEIVTRLQQGWTYVRV